MLATQNPIEQEGTYNLPEAQLDRFMFKIHVDYPSADEELEIMERVAVPAGGMASEPSAVFSGAQLGDVRRTLEQLIVEPAVRRYIVDVVTATRQPGSVGLSGLEPFVDFGASTRASIALFQAARAHAFMRKRGYVSPEDVKAIAADVLRHRVILSYEAEAEGKTVEQIIRTILEHVHVP